MLSWILRYREQIRAREKIVHGLLFTLSFLLVTTFIALPDPAQDYIISQVPISGDWCMLDRLVHARQAGEGPPTAHTFVPPGPIYPPSQIIPVIVGAIAYGLKLFYNLVRWLVALPVAGLVLLIMLAGLLAWLLRGIYLRLRNRAKPSGEMLTPIPVPTKRSKVAVLSATEVERPRSKSPRRRKKNSALRR